MNYIDVAKNIVDRLYNEIQCKITYNLTLYSAVAQQNNANKTWLAGECKRYKQLLSYVTFLRKNKAYYKIVAAILEDELKHGNKPLHMDTEPDTSRLQQSDDTISGQS